MFSKKIEYPKDSIVIKLENDIESTHDDRSSEVESFWSSIHGLQDKKERPTFSFEILSDKKGAAFYLAIPKRFQSIIGKKLNAVYPYIEIKEVADPVKEFSPKIDEHVYSCELKLTNHESFNLKTSGLSKTFLNNLLNTMNHFNEDDSSLVQILIKPLPESWNHKAQRNSTRARAKSFHSSNPIVKGLMLIVDLLVSSVMLVLDSTVTNGQLKKSFKEVSATTTKTEKDDKFSKPCFNVSVRIASKSKDAIVAEQTAKSISTVFQNLDSENKLRPKKITFKSIEERFEEPKTFKNSALNVQEMSQFIHLPGKGVSADNVGKGNVKMPYDKNVPSKGIVFGYSPQKDNKPVAFPMKVISLEKYDELYDEYEKLIDNLCKPRLVLGQMGTGKSEWVVNYTLSLINAGLSVIIVDPKNDTQERLIQSISEDKIDKIDYLNLGDLIFPPGMNLLRRRNPGDPTEISLIVQSLISFFKKEFGRSWGFAMQQLIMMTGNAILLDEVATLYEFQLMLTNKEYRAKMIDKIEAKIAENSGGKAMLKELLQFWKQFHSWPEKNQMDRISSTMNKIGVFMSNRIVRAIVSQEESYDFRKAGDNGRITIVNIPDGELQDENRELLASFINKAIWLDFRSRASMPIRKRYPTMWLIEEAHMVMDTEFIPVLTQSRGYRLGVTVLTQGLTNFDNKGMSELKDLILTNCKNKVVFRVGPQDARALAEEFSPLTSYDLMNCPDYHFYSKILLEDGKVSDVFFANSPPVAPELRDYQKYKEASRSGKYTIDEIEDRLDSRHNLEDTSSIMNLGLSMEEEKTIVKEEKPKKRRAKPGLEFLDN
ncbi:gp156 [Bacillus phage G]|uniref:Gp156 n=1 Tax=Bacillus phage G TaxID=2884420 RepID=G3MBM2_9CAUD|nr:gp156 [Bacillus phage G]AEO93416.1 gp156 [Bacillus phage G]